MNDWDTIRKTAIVEADDFQDKYNRNGLSELFYWKAKYPKFKITLFTIPNRTSLNMLRLIFQHCDWIELAVHGWDHESNFECYNWSYDKTKSFMDRVKKINDSWDNDYFIHYKKIFKAPGWTITGGYNGYPPHESSPIALDPQGVYRALIDMDYVVFDRHYNKPARPEGEKIVCVDCNPNIVHMHTWDMETGDKNGRNGFRQVEEEQGVPWDQDTEFFFVSEAIKKGLIQPCK